MIFDHFACERCMDMHVCVSWQESVHELTHTCIHTIYHTQHTCTCTQLTAAALVLGVVFGALFPGFLPFPPIGLTCPTPGEPCILAPFVTPPAPTGRGGAWEPPAIGFAGAGLRLLRFRTGGRFMGGVVRGTPPVCEDVGDVTAKSSACVCMYCMYVCGLDICVYSCTRTHTYIHPYIHTHTHMFYAL
jgi:hypothetical protein